MLETHDTTFIKTVQNLLDLDKTYLITALVVAAGWELPLLIVPFIWFSCCCWPPPPPPGAPAGFTEPLSCPFWLDKPKITGFSVLAVLIFALFQLTTTS